MQFKQYEGECRNIDTTDRETARESKRKGEPVESENWHGLGYGQITEKERESDIRVDSEAVGLQENP